MKRFLILFAAAALVALLAAPAVMAGGVQEKPAAAPGMMGGTVSVLAVWGGQELDVFKEMVKPFEARTGILVQYEGTRDIDAVLTTRVQAGNPPDVAALPGPGKMAELAKAGKLVDLSGVLDMEQIRKDYAQGWLDMGTVNGKLVGVFLKAAIKGLVWYDPKALKAAGISLPATWDELMADSRRLADSGTTPWAIGLESGAASGWVGTDWIENIFLRQNGPDKYRQWYEGKLPWTSPEVRQAWQTWGRPPKPFSRIHPGPTSTCRPASCRASSTTSSRT
jgi:alpha-glucoside transport system substrate-binding protein